MLTTNDDDNRPTTPAHDVRQNLFATNTNGLVAVTPGQRRGTWVACFGSRIGPPFFAHQPAKPNAVLHTLVCWAFCQPA